MTKEVIEELTYLWHKSESRLELHEFLGCSEENYFAYLETNAIGFLDKSICDHSSTIHFSGHSKQRHTSYDLCLICNKKLNFKVN